MKLWLIAHADVIATVFVLANAALLVFFALRWHVRATSPTSQPARPSVVKASTRAAPPGNIFTTWEAGRRG